MITTASGSWRLSCLRSVSPSIGFMSMSASTRSNCCALYRMSAFSPSVANEVLNPVGWMTAWSISWIESRSSTMRTEDMQNKAPATSGAIDFGLGPRLLQSARDRAQLEDGQEHGDHDAADHDTEEND